MLSIIWLCSLLLAIVILNTAAGRMKTSSSESHEKKVPFRAKAYEVFTDDESEHSDDAAGGLKGLGSACNCADNGWEKNTCCNDGLICSVTEKKCKPAIGGLCAKKTIGTNCAKGTYGAGHSSIGCRKFHGTTTRRCCIEGMLKGKTKEA